MRGVQEQLTDHSDARTIQPQLQQSMLVIQQVSQPILAIRHAAQHLTYTVSLNHEAAL